MGRMNECGRMGKWMINWRMDEWMNTVYGWMNE